MIANRPDWTLSRQRQWGVPMPFFIHKETGALHPHTLELLEQVAQRVEKGGIEAWQTLDVDELGVDDLDQYVKIKDTLDVWFDSGSTHQTVLGGPAGRETGAGSHARDTAFPADLYLEGSDQHRGWFHSSLLVSCMLNGTPPYKALLTHGFAVDGEGRKMSKSKGNGVEPQKVSSTLGAEILRLWVAATDYSGELSISDEILKRVVESYRRIRNTLRFLLANTSDFDAATDAVPLGELLEIDRYALAAAQALADAVQSDYARYEFHLVVQRLQTFCSEDLGGFYLDVLKDRLYTAGKASRARRSAQTALALIRDALLELMAPVLSFTAEEAWRIVHPADAVDLLPDLDRRVAEAAGCGGVARQVVAHPRGARRRAEGAGDAAPGREGRLVAAGGSDDHRGRRRLRRARQPRRRSALRADHFGGRGSSPGDGARDQRDAERAREVRALLALSRRCRRRRRAPDAVRTLRGEPVRGGRAARIRVNESPVDCRMRIEPATARPNASDPPQWARWLWLSAGVIAADQLTKAAILAIDPRGGRPGRHAVLQPRADVQHRCGVQLPRRRIRLAALVLRGHRGGRGDPDRRAAAARRQRDVQRRPGADPGRRARQSLRSPRARQGRRFPAVPLRGLGLSRRSTSPTARSPSARRCSSSTASAGGSTIRPRPRKEIR